jgi:hypothetical protein
MAARLGRIAGGQVMGGVAPDGRTMDDGRSFKPP